MNELIEQAGRTYISALDVAIIHAALGAREHALDWLERAFEERADHLPYLKVNPRLDVLRDEPRFRRLQQKMGLD